jgi:hypothetical protein
MADSRSESWRRGRDSNPGTARSAVFKSGSGRSLGFVEGRFTRESAIFPGLESAGVRPCCYRLLLPVQGRSDEIALVLFAPSRGPESRARRDSNPRPSDPKSGSRRGEQSESIRAWNGHREDAVFVDSGVSQDPSPERLLVPSREPERVRCPRRNRLPFKCPRRVSGIVRLDGRRERHRPSNRRYGRSAGIAQADPDVQVACCRIAPAKVDLGR